MPIVTNPTAGDVHVNGPLTNFSQKYIQDESVFIATRAFPNVPVAKQSDLYYTFSRADFFRDEAEERADGTESAGGGFNLSTDPYFARVYAYHKDVTDRQRDNQDSSVQLDQSATQFVTQKLLIRRERLFVTAMFSTGVWTGGASDDENVNWLVGGSNPITDIRLRMQDIHSGTGFRPNKMIIGRQGFDTLMDQDDILARITGGANNALPAQVQKQLLAQLFELDEIFVMDSVFNSALEGATESTDFIGGDNCLLYYAPNSVALDQPTAGLQFSWTGFRGATNNGMRIKRMRAELREADRIEGQMAFDYQVTAPELGHMFTSVSAA
jgi:hypothetical protein